jgi:hypothetical protein
MPAPLNLTIYKYNDVQHRVIGWHCSCTITYRTRKQLLPFDTYRYIVLSRKAIISLPIEGTKRNLLSSGLSPNPSVLKCAILKLVLKVHWSIRT